MDTQRPQGPRTQLNSILSREPRGEWNRTAPSAAFDNFDRVARLARQELSVHGKFEGTFSLRVLRRSGDHLRAAVQNRPFIAIFNVQASRKLAGLEPATGLHEQPNQSRSPRYHFGIAILCFHALLHQGNLNGLVERELAETDVFRHALTTILPDSSARTTTTIAGLSQATLDAAPATVRIISLRVDAGITAQFLTFGTLATRLNASLSPNARVAAGPAVVTADLRVHAHLIADSLVVRAGASAPATSLSRDAGGVARAAVFKICRQINTRVATESLSVGANAGASTADLAPRANDSASSAIEGVLIEVRAGVTAQALSGRADAASGHALTPAAADRTAGPTVGRILRQIVAGCGALRETGVAFAATPSAELPGLTSHAAASAIHRIRGCVCAGRSARHFTGRAAAGPCLARSGATARPASTTVGGIVQKVHARTVAKSPTSRAGPSNGATGPLVADIADSTKGATSSTMFVARKSVRTHSTAIHLVWETGERAVSVAFLASAATQQKRAQQTATDAEQSFLSPAHGLVASHPGEAITGELR